ncbi:hydrogenobyrinic acid a,c-diamide synthase (glutamine-hydrolysing) /cobyrinate a,c-diamide synthase [Marinobacter daqiaonensis]|uniref:Hydrogenobyrinic acid a,c-diamide synthase (Glutamine-hydrolysing) /cobyrinate a,c-diamide synthase n=1 Tax=Marinobacter daqiaonensis TaxID=650891 RepID=A0A1I6JNR7_9GAMM|nr:cobyrinate a,c-diamide synthase [Marinobacter daqiaonensis]SFR80551.1 hydrogenobyrinic acid a,c-diamide synthase (glutamine-hydrolysing) /cobyrinate a,c-diamide synthase [Marinobacter daqiaonensis]
MPEATIPAAMITAPGSGQGKSMVTAALARLHRNAGRKVRVFKHGPDYLDPMVLEVASGQPVYQLHPWMTGEEECRWRLTEAARDADLILVEGSMGLFDGDPSTADLAKLMGLPALPVIDARGMAQTFGAVALGLASFDPQLPVRQVIANRIGSARHGEMLRASLPECISLLGAIPRHEAMDVPDRHLGLVQAGEMADLDRRLDAAAGVLLEAGLGELPVPVTLTGEPPRPVPALLESVTIAIARDAAFSFLYRANLDLLRAMGAELIFFSPLADSRLPGADALWLPGGYPELHGATLAGNRPMAEAIRQHHAAGKPILAECGGLMACMDSLVDREGHTHTLFGLMPGQTVMADRLQALGLQGLKTDLGELRGHTYHHSRLDTPWQPAVRTRRVTGAEGEPVFSHNGLFASYFHGYFPSAPELVAAMFRGEAIFQKETSHA